jgi:hypothetical protein
VNQSYGNSLINYSSGFERIFVFRDIERRKRPTRQVDDIFFFFRVYILMNDAIDFEAI